MVIKIIDQSGLSDREADVLVQVAAGCSDKEIARVLDISTRTVMTHCQHIYRKMLIDEQRGNARCKAVSLAVARRILMISDFWG